jgi:hypothetical protein
LKEQGGLPLCPMLSFLDLHGNQIAAKLIFRAAWSGEPPNLLLGEAGAGELCPFMLATSASEGGESLFMLATSASEGGERDGGGGGERERERGSKVCRKARKFCILGFSFEQGMISRFFLGID